MLFSFAALCASVAESEIEETLPAFIDDTEVLTENETETPSKPENVTDTDGDAQTADGEQSNDAHGAST